MHGPQVLPLSFSHHPPEGLKRLFQSLVTSMGGLREEMLQISAKRPDSRKTLPPPLETTTKSILVLTTTKRAQLCQKALYR